MSALIHTPLVRKSAAGAYWVQTPRQLHPPSPRRHPLSSISSPANITARAVKNLITKKFWHSVSLVLVTIYRPEFSLSLSPSFSLLLSASLPPHLATLSIGYSSRRSTLSFFLSRAAASLRSRVSVVYSSPPRTTHRHPLRSSTLLLALSLVRPSAPIPIGRPRFL